MPLGLSKNITIRTFKRKYWSSNANLIQWLSNMALYINVVVQIPNKIIACTNGNTT